MNSCLEKLQKALNKTIAGMSDEELSWHPEGKWCAAEILEHLYLTYTGTAKGFERLEQKAKANPVVTPSTWAQRTWLLLVLGAGYLPEGRKAPRNTEPKGLARAQVCAEYCDKIKAMDEAIARCEARFGGKVKLLDHPILGPLTGSQWRKFHLVHGLHHVKQIRRLRAGWLAQRGS